MLSQNYPNLEYIVIDGGSTDGSIDVIQKYEEHLSYWICEKDTGQYDAINKGFSYCNGDIMGWLNGDDLLFPGALYLIGNIFAHNEKLEWLTGIASVINSDDEVTKVSPQYKFRRESFFV